MFVKSEQLVTLAQKVIRNAVGVGVDAAGNRELLARQILSYNKFGTKL